MPLLPKEQTQKIGTDLIELLEITDKRIELDSLQNRTTLHTNEIERLIKPLCENATFVAGNSKLQFAIAMSLAKLTEYNALRKNGDPYFVHVLSVMHRTVINYAPAGSKPKERIPAYIGAVLHDYFEEGDGVTPQSVELIAKYFGEYGRAFCEELVMLTEPNYKEFEKFEDERLANLGAYIDYDQFKKQYDLSRKLIEATAMVYVYSNGRLPKAVVPNDKLDNIANFPLIAALRTQKKCPNLAPESEEFKNAAADELCEMYTIASIYGHTCEGVAGNQLMSEVVAQLNKVEIELPMIRSKMTTVASKNLAHHFSLTLNSAHPLIIAMREYCNKLNLHLIAEDLR